MEAKTLAPDAGAEAEADAAAAAAAPQTLAAGELVWAKPSKPRRHCWWPARLLAACPAAARDARVAYFGDPAAPAGAPPAAAPAQVRRFADPDADGLARGSTSRAFLAAVEEAHARAVAVLRAQLTCGCVPPPTSATGGVGVANLAPAEFLAALHDAALGAFVYPVGLVDRARLKSWVHAYGEGWGTDGAKHYPRRPLEDLVDKIDLDVPAGEDRDADDWLAEDEHKPLERPQETPGQKKRSVAAVMGELEDGEDEGKDDGSVGLGTSGKRERKKSKYLSPPYTNLGVMVLPRKPVDSPKASVSSAAEGDSKMLPETIIVSEILLLVRGLGKDVRHGGCFSKAAEGFLSVFRSSKFMDGAEYKSYEVHECPAALVSGKATADISAGSLSDSHAVQGKSVSKRGRKKDEDVNGGSSIKRKKREKTSPAATLGSGMPITPATPIRQMKAADMRTLMKVGSAARGVGVQDEKSNPSLFGCPISAAVPGAIKQGGDQVEANGKPVVETPVTPADTSRDQSARERDESKQEGKESEANANNVVVDVPVKSVQTEANICTDGNVQSAVEDGRVGIISKEPTQSEASVRKDVNVKSSVADVPDRAGSKEATESEADIHVDKNVQSAVADVPDRGVSKESMKSEANIHIDGHVQSVVHVSSGLSPMHGDRAPVDENKEYGSVEVRTVQQSYASLQAMIPEMLKKAENTNGTDAVASNDTLKYERQKDERPDQNVKLPAGAEADYSSGEIVNGTCPFPDPANSTHKKKKEKATQYFEYPAAIIVEFKPGVIVPTREELLSTFGKYGFLIESQTEITKATCSARVVFGKRTEADRAYNSADLLGQFGPAFAKLRLDYPPPIKLNAPLPSPSLSLASKPPLTDIRKNLEKMISARHLALKKANSSDGLNAVPDKLLGDMQGLLAQVDKVLSGPANTP